MGLHRDIQNMPGHLNHALALGDYTGGRVWIEDDDGDSTAWLADKKGGRELRGRWLDMHDKPVSFDARSYHMVEPHEGSMWALAAYVPQAFARATEQHRQARISVAEVKDRGEGRNPSLRAVYHFVAHCWSSRGGQSLCQNMTQLGFR